jgi:plasmid stabilization system protein ParE
VIAHILAEAEAELEAAFDHYAAIRAALAEDLLHEFRRAVDQIQLHPRAWHPLDETYRRCRVHRFPYGIVYRHDASVEQLVIVAFMHLSRRPGMWRGR